MIGLWRAARRGAMESFRQVLIMAARADVAFQALGTPEIAFRRYHISVP